MAQVTKNIISPVHVNENGSTFIAIDGKAFLISDNKITEAAITSAPGEFRSLVLALENFKVTNEGLTWYHGVSRFKYVKESNKFYIANTEVLAESFERHLLATGLVNYQMKSKVQLFEFAAKNHDKFASLEFVEKIEEGHIKCYVMKLDESFFVYRMNEANKIYKFDELNAADCYDYVLEQTGHELVMASELLEGERAKAAEKSEKIKVLEQMVAFLKDQRGVIAEADKSIDEIKAADTLINSEIKRIEEEIENLRNDIEETEEAEETENVEEAESDATDSETMEDGEEAGEPAEEIEKDAEDVDSDEEREAESEEATDEAPEAEGEEGKDDVAGEEEETETPEDESTGDQDDEVEDEGDSDVEESEELEAEKKTNEADLEENEIDRADGYVPGTLRFKNEEFAEGTEIKVDAEGYTTAGSDDSVNVFIDEQPKKVLKRDIALADSETI